MQHLEDLSLDDFIRAVENIAEMHVSEKLDGANLWLGIDERNDQLFTTREGKSRRASRFYSEAEYPRVAAYNGFRGVHAALQQVETDVRQALQPGQMVELEVLYGRQPNAVVYGAGDRSYIAFLRGVNGTPDEVADRLTSLLGNRTVQVTVKIITTTDGESLVEQEEKVTWQFTGAQKLDTSALKEIPIEKHLNALRKFLEQKSGIGEYTNGEIISLSLTSIDKEVRPAAKQLRAELLSKIMTDFKLPIKRELLDKFVGKIKPQLQHHELSDNEDVGIEGVVLRDDEGNLIKLVDKDTFTTINAFNHAVRNQISNVVRTIDATAPLEARGGITGTMKGKIADLLGNEDLARGGPAKRIFAQVKGKTPAETVKNFTKNLNINDFLGVKRKVLALIQQAHVDMKALLANFKENKGEFKLVLKNGKTIGISDEIEKRTLLVFAESLKNIRSLFDKVKKARTPAQLIATLYGGIVVQVHEGDSLKEDLLLEKKYDTDKARYSGKDAWTILNIYIATVLMSILIYKVNDVKGMRMLKDKSNYRLTSWNKDMSPLNFWGYPVWRASQPAVKKLIGNKAAQQIFKIARRAAPSAPRLLHMDLSFGKDVPIDWNDHRKTIYLLQQFEGLNTDRINSLVSGIFNYDTLSRDQKVKILAKLFYYVNQFIPTSPLFIRIKAIQDELLLNANGENDQMVETVQAKLLNQVVELVAEDDTGDGAKSSTSVGAAASSVVDTVTRAQDVNASPEASKKRILVRRRRNPNIKRLRFRKPENAAI